MKTLYAVVTYNGPAAGNRKTHSKVAAPGTFYYPSNRGRINISPAGNIFIDNYPKELANQMRVI